MDARTLQLLLNLIQLLGAATRMSAEIKMKYDEHRAKLQQFIDEDRNPTAEEHEELNKSIEDLLSQI